MQSSKSSHKPHRGARNFASHSMRTARTFLEHLSMIPNPLQHDHHGLIWPTERITRGHLLFRSYFSSSRTTRMRAAVEDSGRRRGSRGPTCDSQLLNFPTANQIAAPRMRRTDYRPAIRKLSTASVTRRTKALGSETDRRRPASGCSCIPVARLCLFPGACVRRTCCCMQGTRMPCQ